MGRLADVAVTGHKGRLSRIHGRDSASSTSLSEGKRDQRNGQEQNQVNRASAKMRFNVGINLFFHQQDLGTEQCVLFSSTKVMGVVAE